jgi:peptidoglycan/xylan/chitin deacetylase (PgdA/CDA1 family)
VRLVAMDGPLTNRTSRAVFLCYHSVHPDGPPFISVTPEAFEEQLAVLATRGFRTGGTAELDELAAGRRAPRTAFISFDDGYADNHELALPILRERGARATFFVLPPQVGQSQLDWPEAREYAERHPHAMRALSWPQVEELAEAGMTIGSHTNNHHHLPRLDDEQLTQELLDSRRAIAERLGVCDVMAYPYGEWDLRVALAAANAGYRYAFSLPPAPRPLTTAMSIPRINVDHRDTTQSFALKLQPGVRALICSRLTGRIRVAKIQLRELRAT